jgi:hypothetical protein
VMARRFLAILAASATAERLSSFACLTCANPCANLCLKVH